MEPAASAADLEQIFREHHALVFRAAYRITGNATDAEDVLQTVFLRMLKRDKEAEPVTNLPSFLHRAAVNAAVDLMRARRNAKNIPSSTTWSRSSPMPRTVIPTALGHRAKSATGSVRPSPRLNPRIAEMFYPAFF